MPLRAHPQIWPRFQVYAGCPPLAPPPTEDFVPYNFLSLAIPPGSCSRISSRPLPHYHGNSGSSLSPLNRAGSSSRSICPHCNYAESRLLSCCPSLWNGLYLWHRLFPRVVSNSFYAHLKTFLFGRAGIGSAPE